MSGLCNILSQQSGFLPKRKITVLSILITHLVFGSNATVGAAKAVSLFIRIFLGIMFSVMYDWIRIGTQRIFGNI